MLVYRGSKERVEYPEIRTAKYHKDFYFGFCCTTLRAQAERWALRFTGSGFINVYEYTPDDRLRVKRFPELSEEWLDFVAACRIGTPHDFDIVEGPMADDAIFNYVQVFLDGNITRAAFWELARFKKPTHQISFHTARALATLRFVKGEAVRDGD